MCRHATFEDLLLVPRRRGSEQRQDPRQARQALEHHADEVCESMAEAARDHSTGDVVVQEGLFQEVVEARNEASTAKARARFVEAAEQRKAMRRVVFE